MIVVNAIYLYDDHLKIIYNVNGKEETISFAELESSTLFSCGAPKTRRGCSPCGFLVPSMLPSAAKGSRMESKKTIYNNVKETKHGIYDLFLSAEGVER